MGGFGVQYSGGVRRTLRRVVAGASVASLLGLGAVVVAPTGPVGAAPDGRPGTTQQTAGTSCWSIKQSYPSSPDGIYWLWTPRLVTPEQFYCDMTTDGGGWVLIGRGRDGWTFPYWGQGSPAKVRNTVTGSGAFDPASLPTPTVVGLLNGARMDSLADGIRLRRATNTAGTTWQEVRQVVKDTGTWTWGLGGGVPLASMKVDAASTTFATSTYRTNTTADAQLANDMRRVWTYPAAIHGWRAGFSFGGAGVTGLNNATSFLWQSASEGNAIPFTQVFIRPKLLVADLAASASVAPDAGLPASTIRPMLDRVPVDQNWGVTGLDPGVAVPDLKVYVKSIVQMGSRIYMGGKFLEVQQGDGGPAYPQPYLAAFDVATGEWIPSFAPVLNGPVWELLPSPDGTRLLVGGEFTSVNGVAGTVGLAALDPTTGAPVAASSWTASVTRTTGTADVRAMAISGNWLYVGGNFTKISGGYGTNAAGPISVGRIARIRLSDGRPDWTWLPTLDTSPWDVSISADGTRAYLVGSFDVLNGTTLPAKNLAVVSTSTGLAVAGLKTWKPSYAAATDPGQAILEYGDHVYVAGSQHSLQSYARSDFTLERAHTSFDAGGDFQALAVKDGILYASCHCVTDWQFQDSNTFPSPSPYTRADPLNLIAAYDTTDNQAALPEFHPTKLRLGGAGGTGPFTLFFDSNDCMWAGGDLLRAGADAIDYYGGYEKFCPRDVTAPPTPTNARAAVASNTVTLAWNAVADDRGGPVQYEVLRDDPVLGTIVEGSTFERSWTDTGVSGANRYFVRAADANGNRSATTTVINVAPPPPVISTIIPSGSTWSYRADGQNLGTGWRERTTDTSAWTTGPAQFGWGGKGEVTAIPKGPITSYYVKHIDVADPGAFRTVTLSMRVDDGAVVFINGVEAVRANMPSGRITANTVASSYVSGGSESRWIDYAIPASLLRAGDNSIAVEVHQADINNGDAIFDVALVGRGSIEAVAPTTPVVTVADTGISTVALTWTASADPNTVIGYLVRRNGVPIAFTTGLALGDSGLSPDTAYAYSVTAFDTSGNPSTPGTIDTRTKVKTALVLSGDSWSFRADGTTPEGWNQPGFDATSWASGPSQLGWGGRGELTPVPSGQITQYFVRHIQVTNPAQYAALTLSVKRDDGIAVSVNGIEAYRDNLPAGPLTASTFPTAPTTAADGVAWRSAIISPNLLVAGDNVIAVEVHQNSRTDARAVFDLALEPRDPTETSAPSRPEVSSPTRTDYSASLTWSPSVDDTGVVGYLIQRDGITVGTTAGLAFTDTGLLPDTVYGYTVLAFDASGNESTAGALALRTTLTRTVVRSGDTWSFWSDGTTPAGWNQVAFDAGAWASGPSQLGWGGRGEVTTVPSGQITQYYRRSITAPSDVAASTVTLRFKRDDAIAVYVNGLEVHRDNLPGGALTANTYPLAITSAGDGVTWREVTIPGTAFQPGANLLATEVHQNARSDGRSVFDLELLSTTPRLAPVLTVASPQQEGYATEASPTVSGLCTSDAGTVTVEVVGAVTATGTAACDANMWSLTVPMSLPDGPYVAVASQTDADGHLGTTPGRAFTVDTVAPVVSIESPVSAMVLGAATPTVAGRCGSDEGPVTVTVSGASSGAATGNCTSGTFAIVLPALVSGLHAVVASQTDAAGLIGTSASTGFAVDLMAPTTTDNTAVLGSGWFTTPQTVVFSAIDAGGSTVAATYYTTDGSVPTRSSSSGSTVELSGSGAFTIKYFSVDALGNAEAVRTAAVVIRQDLAAPTTTDNTATIGSATKSTAQTIRFTPTDTGGSGLGTTYYTVDGTDPTTTSATGTSAVLSLSGRYTIKYFSTDLAGNAEPIRTASTVITIDAGGPVVTITSPVNGGAYNSTKWRAQCGSTVGRICGTAADPSGVARVTLTIKRVSDGRFFDGSSGWGSSRTLSATGTTSWTYDKLTTSVISGGQSYTITVTSVDALGFSGVAAVTFVYDTTAPSVSSAAVTNKNFRIETGDTFSVTFREAIDPSSLPTTGTLSMVRRSSGNTTYAISGLTNGAQDTGANVYLALPSGTTVYTVNFAGTFTLSNSNRTITFTVTGACSGSCTALITTAKNGGWKYAPATTLRDPAGNVATGSYTSTSTAMF
ncbi:MAG: fibrinogen-like YCDxxxxGGGW domain-containing protein [Actinomycetes bacterium]